jgi:hypothetical protein
LNLNNTILARGVLIDVISLLFGLIDDA